MAPKRPIETLPSPVYSSEEEDPSEENNNDDDDEETEDESPVSRPTVAQQRRPFSDSDDDSEDTIPSPNVSDFTIKPIVSYSSPTPTKSKRDDSERPAQAEPIASGSKKSKTNPSSSPSTNHGGDDDSKKVSSPQRLWSEEDEIAILKGMHEFQTDKGTDPLFDTAAFYDFIRKGLRIGFSKSQVADKMRRLKKKYMNNVERVGKSGESSSISKPHEINCFELSKKIWGEGDVKKVDPMIVTLGLPRQIVGGKKTVSKREEKQRKVNDNSSGMGGEEKKVEVGLSENGDRREMDKERRKMKIRALELYIKKLDLEKEEARLVLESMKLNK